MVNERNVPSLPSGVTVADLVEPFSGFDSFDVSNLFSEFVFYSNEILSEAFSSRF